MFACLALLSSAPSGIEPDALEAVARAFSPRVEVHRWPPAAGAKARARPPAPSAPAHPPSPSGSAPPSSGPAPPSWGPAPPSSGSPPPSWGPAHPSSGSAPPSWGPALAGPPRSARTVAQRLPAARPLPQLVTLDIDGLRRLLGGPDEIGRELAREAADRGCAAHVAIAATRTAAMLLALARPGLTVVPRGEERERVSVLPLAILGVLEGVRAGADPRAAAQSGRRDGPPLLDLFRRWGLRTLGDLARLPASALSARVGQEGLQWQRAARGDDLEPLVAAAFEPPIEEAIDLDWPVEGLEPLSFLLPRLLDPICARLERLDQAAVVVHLSFRLATRERQTRCLQLPAPMRDAKVLRTLILLHLESHPLPAGVDRLAILVEPAPARIVQFSLLTRALPFPEQVATLVARLGALMGERRVGRAVLVDSHRPGAFAMQPFAITEGGGRLAAPKLAGDERRRDGGSQPVAPQVVLRRFRLPVPARVLVEGGRPVRIASEREGLEGGRVEASAGPWRTSGDWWRVAVETAEPAASPGRGGAAAESKGWDRDEWDVALADGAIYRVYRDRASERWFIEGILD